VKTDNEIEQRLQIRARLASHLLPYGPAHQVFGGLGTQAICNCCDQRIGSDQVEFEVELKTIGGGTRKLMMHSLCFRLWSDESDLSHGSCASQAAN